MNKSNFGMLRSPDPLDTDCGGINTSFPLPKAEQTLRFEIRKPSAAPGKSDAGKTVILLPCHTMADCKGTKNDTIHSGYMIRHYLTVDTRTPEATDKTCRGIAQVVKAVGKKLTPRQVIDSGGAVLDGAVFNGKTKINPAQDGYGESAGIGTFIPA